MLQSWLPHTALFRHGMIAVSFAVGNGELFSATTCDEDGNLQKWQSRTSAIMSRNCARALAGHLAEFDTVLSCDGDAGFRALYLQSGLENVREIAKQQRDFQRDYRNDTHGRLDLRATALHTLGCTITACTPSAEQAATLCALWKSDAARRYGKLLTPNVWVLPAGADTIRPAAASQPLYW